MNFEVILLLTIAGLLILVLLVFAALILPARSFTQLAELIRYIGSLVEAQRQENQQAQTFLLQETAKLRSSVLENGTHITRVGAKLDEVIANGSTTPYPKPITASS